MTLQVKGLNTGKTSEMLPAYRNLLDLYATTDQTPSKEIEGRIQMLSSGVNKMLPDEMVESFALIRAGYLQQSIEQLKEGVQWIAMEIFARLSDKEKQEVRLDLASRFPSIASSLCATQGVSNNQSENHSKIKLLFFRGQENKKSDLRKQETSSDFTVKLLKSLNQCTIHRRENRKTRLNQWIEEVAENQREYKQRIAFKEQLYRFIRDETSTALSFKAFRLTSLPEDIFYSEPFVSRLVELDLSGNQISEYPDFSRLKAFKQLRTGEDTYVRFDPKVVV